MSSQLRIKRRAAAGAAGAPSSLKNGELGYNENDNTLYYGYGDDGSGNATSIPPIAGKGAFVDLTSSQTVGGTKTFSSSPVAPTPTGGDNSTKVATTAFVQAAVGGAGGTQSANTVYAGPSSGGSTTPSFRALVAADIPSIPSSKLSDLGSANGAASLDSGGKVPVSQLPSSVLGGLQFLGTIAASGSLPTPSSKGYYVISTAGTFTGTSVALNAGDWAIYDQNSSGDLATNWDYIHSTSNLASIFGRTGVVTAQSGDYNTSQVTESGNLYFTTARVLATALAGLSTSTNAAITSSDTVLSALGKLQAQITAEIAGALHAANNLSDLASASTARTNLGLGTAATYAATAFAQTANNLSDLANAATARTNLGLGTMATQAASAVAITGGTIDSVAITNSSFDGGTF